MRYTETFSCLVLIAVLALGSASAGVPTRNAPAVPAVPAGPESPPDTLRPHMDVVFVLDTTGSMSGLIQTAKEKIWAIANEILRGKPTPALRIGLVAYRDRGDAYVTRVHALTQDLDRVHQDLMGFQATGGGDTPEHVNRALHDAVHNMAWTDKTGAVKLIFLVGDAPPHMDYDDGLDYRKAARDAIARGIMVNTLRIGTLAGTEKVWQEIARLADGAYKEIKVTASASPPVATRLDARVEALRRKLGRPAAMLALTAPGAPVRELADSEGGMTLARTRRAKDGFTHRTDLIDDILDGRVKVESVPESRLTPDLKKLETGARVEKLRALVAERKTLRAELADLEKKRAVLVTSELKERARKAGLDGDEDSFGRAVVDVVKKAAARVGVSYEDKNTPGKTEPGKEDTDKPKSDKTGTGKTEAGKGTIGKGFSAGPEKAD